MYFYGSLHMAEKKQGDRLEPTYSSSVRLRGVALRIYIGFGVCIVTVHLIVSLLDDGSETRKDEKRGVVSHEG